MEPYLKERRWKGGVRRITICKTCSEGTNKNVDKSNHRQKSSQVRQFQRTAELNLAKEALGCQIQTATDVRIRVHQ